MPGDKGCVASRGALLIMWPNFMDRLPGFRDFYPEPMPHQDVWSADARQYLFNQWRATARCHGFREYDGPPVEALELYTTKSGGEIVGQLYNFTDKGGREVALRPEMTPTLARMVAAHERAYKKPVKWFAIPQLFRYERQQKGRLREHFQFNADIIGETDPADAELIALLVDSLRALGLSSADFKVRLSSRNAWREFYQRGNGAAEGEYTFYQAVDKIGRDTSEETEKKLAGVGFAAAQVLEFIEKGEPTAELQSVLDNLSARGLRDFAQVDYHVIRGLAYYTGIVFEAFDAKGELRAIAGGGRYDGLIKLLSGGKSDLPALGFGMGDVVLMELLKSRGLLPEFSAGTDVFVIVESEALRSQNLRLVQDFRSAGISADHSLTPMKPDKQFKRALELKARFSARLETGGAGEMVVKVKNLQTREELVVSPGEAAALVRSMTPQSAR
jgi:histidyl-tRNA synthetase